MLHHFFNVASIENLLKEHTDCKKNNSDMLWLFLTLGCWFDQNSNIEFEW